MGSNIKFVYTKNPYKAGDYLANQLNKHLKNGPVVWFLSGGSAIEPAVLTASKLKKTSGLTVSLIDERYGAPGHKDSNWEALLKAGFISDSAKLITALKGRSVSQTAKMYDEITKTLLHSKAYKIAILGIGPDGHTAGILPDSEAVSSNDSVCYYETPELKRLTLTFKALRLLDEAVVYAMGNAKKAALKNLKQDLPLNTQPAQILKQIRKVTIFSDIREEQL